MMKKILSGIYKITNRINGKIYVGSSADITRRWCSHRSLLGRGKHSSIHLQRAVDKCGIDNFTFEIVKEVETDNLLIEEQKLLDFLKPFGDNGYNISKVAGSPMKGVNHTEEVKARLSEKLSGENHPHYGKPVSEEWREKISKSRKRFTDEQEADFRRRLEGGEPLSRIAKDIGVHITTITRAINRSKRFGY